MTQFKLTGTAQRIALSGLSTSVEQERHIHKALKGAEVKAKGRGHVVFVSLTEEDADYLANWYEKFAGAVLIGGNKDQQVYYEAREVHKATEVLRGKEIARDHPKPEPKIEEQEEQPKRRGRPRKIEVKPASDFYETLEKVQTPFGTGRVIFRQEEPEYREHAGLRFFHRHTHFTFVLDSNGLPIDF